MHANHRHPIVHKHALVMPYTTHILEAIAGGTSSAGFTLLQGGETLPAPKVPLYLEWQ